MNNINPPYHHPPNISTNILVPYITGAPRQSSGFPISRPESPLDPSSSFHTRTARPQSPRGRRSSPSRHHLSPFPPLRLHHPHGVNQTSAYDSVVIPCRAGPWRSTRLGASVTGDDLEDTVRDMREEVKKLQVRNKALIDDCLEKDGRIWRLKDANSKLQRELKASATVSRGEANSYHRASVVLPLNT